MIRAEQPSASNAIAISAAIIGLVSGCASGVVGYSHAEAAWNAAEGSNAGLSDYIDVTRAFWDALPIAAMAAVIVGLLAAGQYVHPRVLIGAASLIGVLALSFGSQYDPKHLEVYQQTVSSGENDALGLLTLWFTAYGLLAGILAIVAGAGVGYAAGTKYAAS